MTKRLFLQTARLFTVFAALAFLTACASTGTSPSKAGDAASKAGAKTAGKHEVAERAQARWDALLAGEYEVAYEYLSPGYRSTMSATDYEINFRTRRVGYETARYDSHECLEASCTVRMDIGYRVGSPVPGLQEWKGKSMVEERWIKTDGEWYHLPQGG